MYCTALRGTLSSHLERSQIRHANVSERAIRAAALAAVKEHIFYIKTPHESSSQWGKGPTVIDCWRETPEGRLMICWQQDGSKYFLRRL